MGDNQNQPKKTQVKTQPYRDSITLLDSSIFETSHAEKLVQYIRQKRGIRNAKRIFCETTNNAEYDRSFPIEIEPSQGRQKESGLKETSVNKPAQGTEKSSNEYVQSSLNPKVSLKRLSCNSKSLGKRILLKEFEKTAIQDDRFKPIASSTPNFGQVSPNISGISIISPRENETIISLSSQKVATNNSGKEKLPEAPEQIIDGVNRTPEQPIHLVENDLIILENVPKEDVNKAQSLHHNIPAKDASQMNAIKSNKTLNNISCRSSHQKLHELIQLPEQRQLIPENLVENEQNVDNPSAVSNINIAQSARCYILAENSINRNDIASHTSHDIPCPTSYENPKEQSYPAQKSLRAERQQNEIPPSVACSVQKVPDAIQSPLNRSNRLLISESLKSPKRSYLSLRRVSQLERTKLSNHRSFNTNVNQHIPNEERICDVMPTSPTIENQRKSNPNAVLLTIEIQKTNATQKENTTDLNNTVMQLRKDFGESPMVVIPINQTINKTNFGSKNHEKSQQNKPVKMQETKSNETLPEKDVNCEILTSDEEDLLIHTTEDLTENEDENGPNVSSHINLNNVNAMQSKTEISNKTANLKTKNNSSITNTSNHPIDLRIRKNSDLRKSTKRTFHPSDELIDEIMLPLNRMVERPLMSHAQPNVNERTLEQFIQRNRKLDDFGTDIPILRYSSSSSSSSSSCEMLEHFNDNLTDWDPMTRNEVIHDNIPANSIPAWANPIKNASESTVNERKSRSRGRRVIAKVDSLKKSYLNISKEVSKRCLRGNSSFRRKLYSKGDSGEEAPLLQKSHSSCSYKETPTTTLPTKEVARRTLNHLKQFHNSKRKINRKNLHENDAQFETIDNFIHEFESNREREQENLNKTSSIILCRENDDEVFKKPMQPAFKSIKKNRKDQSSSEENGTSNEFEKRNRNSNRKYYSQCNSSFHNSVKSINSSSTSAKRENNNSMETKMSRNLDKYENNVDKCNTVRRNEPNSLPVVDVSAEPNAMDEEPSRIVESENIEIIESKKSKVRGKKKKNLLSPLPTKNRSRENSLEVTDKAPISEFSDGNNHDKKSSSKKGNKTQKSKKGKLEKEIVADASNEDRIGPLSKKTISENISESTNSKNLQEGNLANVRRSSRKRRPPIAYWSNTGKDWASMQIPYLEKIVKKPHKNKKLKTKSVNEKKEKVNIPKEVLKETEKNLTEKTVEHNTKVNKNNKDKVKSISPEKLTATKNVSENPPISKENILPNESLVANDLFNRLKESFSQENSSKRKEHPVPDGENTASKMIKISEKPQSKDNNNENNSPLVQIYRSSIEKPASSTTTIPSSDDGISTSEENHQTPWHAVSHRTQTADLQHTNQDGLLCWLKSFLSSKPATKDKEIVKILQSDNIKIANIQDLIFSEINGVEYAYYLGEENNYGYMRFHPNSIKPRAKTKKFDLKFLILYGALQLVIDNMTCLVTNGDFVTVLKGKRYYITNKTTEPALLFFIKR